MDAASTGRTDGHDPRSRPDCRPDGAHGRSASRLDVGLDLEALRRKIASQPVIEQAKGMLMGYYGIDAEQAFALLRRWSSARHVKLRDLCGAIVDAGRASGPEPYAGLRALLEGAGLLVDPPD